MCGGSKYSRRTEHMETAVVIVMTVIVATTSMPVLGAVLSAFPALTYLLLLTTV